MKWPTVTTIYGGVLSPLRNGNNFTITKLLLVFEWYDSMSILGQISVSNLAMSVSYTVAVSQGLMDHSLGVATAIDGSGCCDAGVEQLVSISDDTDFPTANLKV